MRKSVLETFIRCRDYQTNGIPHFCLTIPILVLNTGASLARKCSNEIEYLDPLHELEPWEKHLFGSDSCLVATGGTGNKEKVAVKFNG